MWLIVDGYNLIRQWPELAMLDREELQAGREALLAELGAYRRARRHEITVVFDGRGLGDAAAGERTAGERTAGVVVRYSRQGETADAVIGRLAAEGRERAVVVSSDRAVVAEARRHGAAALSSPEFLARLEASRIAAVKGGDADEEPRPQKSGKGTAHRLPKAQRKLGRRLRGL
jgi:predicted RNA-binding protein with PIN domain